MTLTLDRVIWHTVVHHSSTSTYIQYQISSESEKLYVDGRMYGWTDWRTDRHLTHVIRWTLRSRPNNICISISPYVITSQVSHLALLRQRAWWETTQSTCPLMRTSCSLDQSSSQLSIDMSVTSLYCHCASRFNRTSSPSDCIPTAGYKPSAGSTVSTVPIYTTANTCKYSLAE